MANILVNGLVVRREEPRPVSLLRTRTSMLTLAQRLASTPLRMLLVVQVPQRNSSLFCYSLENIAAVGARRSAVGGRRSYWDGMSLLWF